MLASNVTVLSPVVQALMAPWSVPYLTPFVDATDITNVTVAAAEYADVVYLPTDNTVAENNGAIYNVCMQKNIMVPVIAGEEGTCKDCAVATITIDYYDLGYKTGEMAYEILVNGADISKMEIEYAPQAIKKYDADICKELGIEVPEGYVAIEK